MQKENEGRLQFRLLRNLSSNNWAIPVSIVTQLQDWNCKRCPEPENYQEDVRQVEMLGFSLVSGGSGRVAPSFACAGQEERGAGGKGFRGDSKHRVGPTCVYE